MNTCKHCGAEHPRSGGFCSDGCRDAARTVLEERRRQERTTETLERGRAETLTLLVGAVFASALAIGVSVWLQHPGATRGPRLALLLGLAQVAYRGHAWAVHAIRVLCAAGGLLGGAEGLALFSRAPAAALVLLACALTLLTIGVSLFRSGEALAFLAAQRERQAGSHAAHFEQRALDLTDQTANAAGAAAHELTRQLPSWWQGLGARWAAVRRGPHAVWLYVGAVLAPPASLGATLVFAHVAERGFTPGPWDGRMWSPERSLVLLVGSCIASGFALKGVTYARAGLCASSVWLGLRTLSRTLGDSGGLDAPPSSSAYYWSIFLCVCPFFAAFGMIAGRPRAERTERRLDAQLRSGLGALIGVALTMLLGRPLVGACETSHTMSCIQLSGELCHHPGCAPGHCVDLCSAQLTSSPCVGPDCTWRDGHCERSCLSQPNGCELECSEVESSAPGSPCPPGCVGTHCTGTPIVSCTSHSVAECPSELGCWRRWY